MTDSVTESVTENATATAATSAVVTATATADTNPSGVTPGAPNVGSDRPTGSAQAGGFTMLGDAGIACEGDACLI